MLYEFTSEEHVPLFLFLEIRTSHKKAPPHSHEILAVLFGETDEYQYGTGEVTPCVPTPELFALL